METKIGLEIHVELSTETKMFCPCKNEYGGEPNTRICPVCMGEPGILPSPNFEAVKKAVKVGIALNSKINRFSIFTRKNYFYPDLPKGYQITQYGTSIAEGGSVNIKSGSVYLERINIEEETAKSIYTENGEVLLDFNRCGIPLLEIVTLPCIKSPEEAVEFLKELRRIIRYLGVSECDMEKGMFRVDSNVSVSKEGRAELKNLNSLKAVYEGLLYEIKRQKEVIEKGEKIRRETRLWDEFKKETRVMRVKEEELDYRYFPEPDLPPLELSTELIEKIKKEIPELPYQKKQRFVKLYFLDEKDAEILVSEKELADYFEEILKFYKNPEDVSSWVITELLAYTEPENTRKLGLSASEIAQLVKSVNENKITRNIGKEILKRSISEKIPISELIKKEEKSIIKGDDIIESAVKEVIEENPDVVEKYIKGKKGVLGFLIGQTMKKLKGRADPKQVGKLILKKLEKNS